MPNPYRAYKIGQNIFLRWSPKAAEYYRMLFSQKTPESYQTLNKISKVTGFSPKTMDKMAGERGLISGKYKNLTPMEKAIKNEYGNKDWSPEILPPGSRGYKWRTFDYKPQVPKMYELDDMKNLYLPSATPNQSKAVAKRFYSGNPKYDKSGNLKANKKPKKSKFPG